MAIGCKLQGGVRSEQGGAMKNEEWTMRRE
jgi:hypothetical protein